MQACEAGYVDRVCAAFGETYPFPLADHLLVLGYMGSHSHGTYVPPSDPESIDDIDLMGVILPPQEYLVGLRDFSHWTLMRDELDVTTYGLRKFVGMLMKGNPNVLGLLWLRPEDYLVRTDWFDVLRQNRKLFATKAAHKTFTHYAQDQLTKMTSYTPAIDEEIQGLEALCLSFGWTVPDIMDGRPRCMPQDGTPVDRANEAAAKLKALRSKFHLAYAGEKRRKLILKYGYDTKNAAHLVRLLSMCNEFLLTGELQVYRENDAGKLRAIKRGEWSLEAVKAEAQELFDVSQLCLGNSKLPDEPDFDRVSKLLTFIISTARF